MSRVSSGLRFQSQQRIDNQIRADPLPKENILKLPTTKLERLLSTYISHDQSGDKLAPPEWWPQDLLFYSNSFDSMRKEALGSSLDWPAILRHALQKYCHHHQKTADEVLRASRKRPLAEIQDGNQQETPMKSKHIKLNLSPIVKVVDVLKPPTPTKDSFMDGLKLVRTPAPAPIKPQSYEVNSRKYPNNIPFSSTVGSIFVRREMYTISKEMYTRKAERLDYYLQTTNPIQVQPNKDYEITFNPRKKSCDRVYRFPTRQHRQGRRYLDGLVGSLCTPCSVPLSRIDARQYGDATVLLKDCKVVLQRM